MGFVEFYKTNDTHIWNNFRDGNKCAFEIIYERNIHILANYGNRLCTDKELVKDAIHDLFIDLWRKRANLGYTDSIKFYLIKAFRNNLIKKIVSRKRINTDEDVSSDVLGHFELSHELSIIDLEIEQERLRQLNNYIDKLPSRQKEAVFLRFYGGLNYTEIAKTMKINQQSAYNMVFRALEMLREKMIYTTSSFLLLFTLL